MIAGVIQPCPMVGVYVCVYIHTCVHKDMQTYASFPLLVCMIPAYAMESQKACLSCHAEDTA